VTLVPLDGPILEVMLEFEHPSLLILIPRNLEETNFEEESCEVIKDLEFDIMGW
jgi:hypothetical protein